MPQGLLKPPTKRKVKNCCFEPIIGEMENTQLFLAIQLEKEENLATLLMTKSKLLCV